MPDRDEAQAPNGLPPAAEGEPTAHPDDPAAENEGVWSFRGLEMSSSDFTSAMIHFYRGEVARANVWRSRLDATTNWAVITTGAALSISFGNSAASLHMMIPISTLLVALFLLIEARRYRYYELWSFRVRLMETDFFAAILASPHRPSPTWAGALADNLLHPQFPISTWEAIGRRFRRVYQYIFTLMAVAWVNKIALHPTPVSSAEQFYSRAAVGAVPGEAVVAVGLAFNVLLFALGWLTAGLRESKGEVLGSSTAHSPYTLLQSAGSAISKRGVSLPGRGEQLGHVITARGDEIAERIMTAFGRGVTAMPAKGMYSGEDRTVLMVALDPVQARYLKDVVYEIDPDAFVIIHAAQSVIGSGFTAPS